MPSLPFSLPLIRSLANQSWLFVKNRAVLCGALTVLLVYVLACLRHLAKTKTGIALDPSAPVGWWAWWDQGLYWKSVKALAAGDLSEKHHWVPIGYALLAAPFDFLLPREPFMIVNGLLLVGCLVVFARLAELMGFSKPTGVVVFLLTTVFSDEIFRQYLIPWTSTPGALLLFGGLMFALEKQTPRRAFFLGLVVGLAPLVRPVDVVALIPAGLFWLFAARNESFFKKTGAAAAGFLLTGGLALLTHWAIYGWKLSGYMAWTSKGRAFLPETLPIKLYSLFLDPHALFGADGDPVALLVRFPWLVLGVIGMTACLFRGGKKGAVALGLFAYVFLYASYFDLIPGGLWRYNNIHYFKWLFPLWGLFAVQFFLDLRQKETRPSLAVALLLFLFLAGWHPVLEPLAAKEAFFTAQDSFAVRFEKPEELDVLDFTGPGHTEENLTFWRTQDVKADGAPLMDFHDARLLPMPFGARLLFLKTTEAVFVEGAFLQPRGYFEERPTIRAFRLVWRWSRPFFLEKRT